MTLERASHIRNIVVVTDQITSIFLTQNILLYIVKYLNFIGLELNLLIHLNINLDHLSKYLNMIN